MSKRKTMNKRNMTNNHGDFLFDELNLQRPKKDRILNRILLRIKRTAKKIKISSRLCFRNTQILKRRLIQNFKTFNSKYEIKYNVIFNRLFIILLVFFILRLSLFLFFWAQIQMELFRVTSETQKLRRVIEELTHRSIDDLIQDSLKESISDYIESNPTTS